MKRKFVPSKLTSYLTLFQLMLVFTKRGLIMQRKLRKETKREGERQKEIDKLPTTQTLRNAARKS